MNPSTAANSLSSTLNAAMTQAVLAQASYSLSALSQDARFALLRTRIEDLCFDSMDRAALEKAVNDGEIAGTLSEEDLMLLKPEHAADLLGLVKFEARNALGLMPKIGEMDCWEPSPFDCSDL